MGEVRVGVVEVGPSRVALEVIDELREELAGFRRVADAHVENVGCFAVCERGGSDGDLGH